MYNMFYYLKYNYIILILNVLHNVYIIIIIVMVYLKLKYMKTFPKSVYTIYRYSATQFLWMSIHI